MIGILAINEDWAEHYVSHIGMQDSLVWLDTVHFGSTYRRFPTVGLALKSWVETARRVYDGAIVGVMTNVVVNEQESWWQTFKDSGESLDTYLANFGMRQDQAFSTWPGMSIQTVLVYSSGRNVELFTFSLQGRYLFRPAVKGLTPPLFSRYFYISEWQQMLDEVYSLPYGERTIWQTGEDHIRILLEGKKLT